MHRYGLRPSILRFSFACALGLGLAAACGPAAAQDYPARAVRWIVPYGPGGGTDIVARIVTKKMAETHGQSFVVENRPGGNTMIGTQAVVNAQPDGYTAMQTAEQIAANESLYKDIKFTVGKDFEFVAPLVRTPLVLLARRGLPVTSPQELVAYMKEQDAKVNYGSWGQGGMNHLTMEAFAGRLGVHPLHVPFTGAAAAVKELLAGNIDLYFSDYGTAMPYIEAGQLTPVLVSTRERLPMLPDLPTAQEAGFEGFDMYSFQGVVMPRGTPRERVERISAEVRQALESRDVHDDLMARGFIPAPGAPDDFRRMVLDSQKEFAAIIRDRKITIE